MKGKLNNKILINTTKKVCTKLYSFLLIKNSTHLFHLLLCLSMNRWHCTNNNVWKVLHIFCTKLCNHRELCGLIIFKKSVFVLTISSNRNYVVWTEIPYESAEWHLPAQVLSCLEAELKGNLWLFLFWNWKRPNNWIDDHLTLNLLMFVVSKKEKNKDYPRVKTQVNSALEHIVVTLQVTFLWALFST